ncbi:hypothetical protein WOLCODRAFT_160147 [Wolfiporia cocos MD-104 SS10]|uniref:Uncharacterized protein n=1 Tax=Wolfiporia cocos (strain MD-104) TaxID=742152 RepID=A0A2H3JA56_WOLCO|nr:hypothetical protein WOLCODRAFT_160147 [Wolfiporia cocos MD-104 SS10]
MDGFIIAQSTGLQVVPHESDSSIQLSWPIPCWVSPGKYSLMILGGEDEDGLTIQFVPISLQKHAIASRCDVSGALNIENSYVNELNVQIPGKRDLPVQFPNTSSTSGPTSASTSTADITVTAGSSGVTLTPTSLPATIVVEPTGTPSSTSLASYPTSSGFSTEYTWTATISGSESVVTVTDTTTTPESITVTMTSLETIVSTTTAPGTTIEFTTTKTMVSTTTMLASASQSSSTGDFLPVNAASPRSPNFTRSLLPMIGAFAAIFLLF